MSPCLHKNNDHGASISVLKGMATHLPSLGRLTHVHMLIQPAVLPALDSRVILHAVKEDLRAIRIPALLSGLRWRAHASLHIPDVPLVKNVHLKNSCFTTAEQSGQQ